MAKCIAALRPYYRGVDWSLTRDAECLAPAYPVPEDKVCERCGTIGPHPLEICEHVRKVRKIIRFYGDIFNTLTGEI